MRYQVLQVNTPAEYTYFSGVDKSWNCSIFNTFEEAKVYAIHWAYPVSYEGAVQMSKDTPFQLGVPLDLGMGDFSTLMMLIIEVE